MRSTSGDYSVQMSRHISSTLNYTVELKNCEIRHFLSAFFIKCKHFTALREQNIQKQLVLRLYAKGQYVMYSTSGKKVWAFNKLNLDQSGQN